MEKVLPAVALGTLLLAGTTDITQACTRVFMNMYPGYLVSARSLDFFSPADPTLVVTPRGVEHNGGEGKNAANWQTQYGSVVIYANGVFPMDGINEKGLAGHTQYYANGSQAQQDNQDKPVLESKAWLSYILDNYATVDDAVKGLRNNVRMVAARLPVEYATDTKHIAIEDVTGDSAIIEIDNGTVNIHHSKNYRVMTNPPTYNEQLANADRYIGAPRDQVPGGQDPDQRMARATWSLNNLPQPDNKNQAQGFVMSVMNNVTSPVGLPATPVEQEVINTYVKYSKKPQDNKGLATYWTTLADLSHKEYHFKSAFAASQVWLSLNDINFSAGQPVKKIADLNDYAEKGWEGNIIAQLQPAD